MTPELPHRYLPLATLGKGGGGEVWSVRDRYSGVVYALKVLGEDATDSEMAALVREAVALSGLEGLGLPRVQRFGRLPGTGRPFLVRDMVEGQSLLERMSEGVDLEEGLRALARAAAQLTGLHRAGLFHGDIKPANVIVQPDGGATLVDLGLAAPWQEGGTQPEGLTPRYAAPELFEGGPLTVRAEVYALGATLAEALERCALRPGEPDYRTDLRRVAARATSDDPHERYPSTDEFAAALRRAARVADTQTFARKAPLWPIVGIDVTAGQLVESARRLAPGAVLRLDGPRDSGRSALLRRVAWSLGVEGRPLVWIDGTLSSTPEAIASELQASATLRGAFLLVDDAEKFDGTSLELVRSARAVGMRLVVVGDDRCGETEIFRVPPLERRVAGELIRRAVPSLTDHLVQRAYEVAEGRPGELQRVVALLATKAVASPEDLECILQGVEGERESLLPTDPLERARHFIDRGRWDDARTALEPVTEETLATAIERARVEMAMGVPATALERLERVRYLAEAEAGSEAAKRWVMFLGRAHSSVANYAKANELLESLVTEPGALGAEALAYQGIVLSYLGQHDDARGKLQLAVTRASEAGSDRVEALALSTLGVAFQRDDRVEDARDAYRCAIVAAERAGEAALLGTTQLNLAVVLKMCGDLAGTIEHLEAAVDMGRRSGRRSTVRQALLNLANVDLYLGRLARARSNIEALEGLTPELAPNERAQLIGAQAELADKSGQIDQAVKLFQACADASAELGRGIDAAEARLEGVLVAARGARPDVSALRTELERAARDLGDAAAHRPLQMLAAARVSWLSGDEVEAAKHLDAAVNAARDGGQKEWLWRALETRSDLESAAGQLMTARRDREDALRVLEEIGARLPRDLREVYWNDPRRRHLRDAVQHHLAQARTEYLSGGPGLSYGSTQNTMACRSQDASPAGSERSSTPLEQRLSRLLEINSELAGLVELDRLAGRVTEYAVELLRAERGFVLLRQEDGTLSAYTSRTRVGDEPHAEFSRSIAKTVMAKGEAVVSLSARDDARMSGFASVHQMMLRAVACVPINSPAGDPIGALYLETRQRSGAQFERELPTLRAFADQVAIAIENARLLNENKERADELAKANAELQEAQARLRELLGDRTAQLNRARKQLRDARETLYGHFGYQGLVGTSAAMRRVYAFVDRLKDTDVPVLITGESGTGKEMVARAIHSASPRSNRKFLGVNCGAIPDNLLESELFGHVRGAFTGADRDRKGLFREGEGGSVLLDEIGEMPTKMQAGMLRVLQERKVRPVGGRSEEEVDVRLIFATNRDLEAMVKEGSFREDLYYRIHVVVVALPALRERPEDIPQLVDHFLGRFAARYKRERKTVSRDALRHLMGFDWPGNVRQLEHVLLNAWVLSDRPELEVEDLSLPGAVAVDVKTPLPSAPEPPDPPSPAPPAPPSHRAEGRKHRVLSEHRLDERERIIKALQDTNWNRVKAAEVSGIPRRTFYRRLREYGIQ